MSLSLYSSVCLSLSLPLFLSLSSLRLKMNFSICHCLIFVPDLFSLRSKSSDETKHFRNIFGGNTKARIETVSNRILLVQFFAKSKNWRSLKCFDRKPIKIGNRSFLASKFRCCDVSSTWNVYSHKFYSVILNTMADGPLTIGDPNSKILL